MMFRKRQSLQDNKQKFQWNELTDLAQLDELDRISCLNKVVIFKHSASCSFSSITLRRFEEEVLKFDFVENKYRFYLVEVTSNRPVSNEIEKRYKIKHESPQLLLVDQQRVLSSDSHGQISFSAVIGK